MYGDRLFVCMDAASVCLLPLVSESLIVMRSLLPIQMYVHTHNDIIVVIKSTSVISIIMISST